jgi:hypothetical protein
MGMRPMIAVVTRETRLVRLRSRWGTAAQAKFLLGQAHALDEERVGSRRSRRRSSQDAEPVAEVAEFSEYQDEDDVYRRTLARLERDLDFGYPIKFIDRALIPNFDFWQCCAVVVAGQDGLVANTAKYVGNLPIVGVNPDPARIDGVLLPFRPQQARAAVGRVLDEKYRSRPVTLAEVQLNDGQRMLAFNDFFIGASSHVSARYTLEIDGRLEPQSSSGVLVSTGAGSTGWLSSLFNMTSGISQFLGGPGSGNIQLPWEDRRLVWAVREPFSSKHSSAQLVAGLLPDGQELVIESLMPTGGVIFSDGIESDFLSFGTGTIARVSAARQHANLVIA